MEATSTGRAKYGMVTVVQLLVLRIGFPQGTPPQPPAAVQPLRRAHAHNDYHHDRPLLDALDHGFSSVEADIFLVDGELLVGHSRTELKKERTLESLYLKPLLRRVRENDGRVYRGGPPFLLLIDVKTEGEPTYVALDRILEKYGEMLTSVREGRATKKNITAVISGNRAWDVIARDSTRYCGVDGRLSDLESDRPAHLMPLISDHWGRHFRWRGEGPMPREERKKLRGVVEGAHAAGRRVRFWATPDRDSPARTALWRELRAAKVDLINTDDLAGLREFLLAGSPPTS